MAAPTEESEESDEVAIGPLGIVPRLSTVAGGVAAWIIIGVSLATVWEFSRRFFFGSGTDWVYEYSGYALVWFTTLSAGYVLFKGRHIHIEFFVERTSHKTQEIFAILGAAIIAIYVGVFAYYMFDMALNAFQTGERAPTPARPPMSVIYTGAFVGLLFFLAQSIHTLIHAVRRLRTAAGRIQYAPLLAFVAIVVLGISVWSLYPQVVVIVLLFTMLFAGIPVFAVLVFVGTLGLYFFFGFDIGLPQTAIIGYKATNSNALLAIPLFILAGVILQKGGIGEELYRLATVMVGYLRGGLGVATVLACGVFAAISGSSVATAATIGVIAIPQMINRGYENSKVYGLVAAGGTLGILIPPSAPMILYSGMTNESTGQLFMGGVLPGLIVMGLFAGYTIITSGAATVVPRASAGEVWSAFREGIWGLLMPILVIGGIYLGVVTATEAGAAALVYALVVSAARRRIRLRDLHGVLAEGTLSSGMIMMIIVGAITLGEIVTLLRIPDDLLAFIEAHDMTTWQVLALLTVAYIILGMFLEVVSILLITLPIVYPLVTSLGVDGLWFGVYLVMLMELALITPPVGLNLFVIKDVAKSDSLTVLRGAVPYFILLAIGIVAITVFPEIVLWLPGHTVGK